MNFRAVLAFLCCCGVGFGMSGRIGARLRRLTEISETLGRVQIEAVRFLRPLGAVLEREGNELADIWTDIPVIRTTLEQEDLDLLRQLAGQLRRMDAASCQSVCRGVCETWQEHVRRSREQGENAGRLWRVLSVCAALLAVIWLI